MTQGWIGKGRDHCICSQYFLSLSLSQISQARRPPPKIFAVISRSSALLGTSLLCPSLSLFLSLCHEYCKPKEPFPPSNLCCNIWVFWLVRHFFVKIASQKTPLLPLPQIFAVIYGSSGLLGTSPFLSLYLEDIQIFFTNLVFWLVTHFFSSHSVTHPDRHSEK